MHNVKLVRPEPLQCPRVAWIVLVHMRVRKSLCIIMTSFSHHLAGGLQMCEEKSEAQEDVTVDSALLVMPCPVYPVFNACLRDKLNYIPDQSAESWPKRTRKKVAAVRLELCFQNLFMAAFIHLKLLCAHTHTHMIATVIKCWSNEFCCVKSRPALSTSPSRTKWWRYRILHQVLLQERQQRRCQTQWAPACEV